MNNELQPVAQAMAGGTRERLGWFSYQIPTEVWTWSEELYQIHGFEPGEIVPTTAVFTSHKHPEDRVHTDHVLATVLATGEPFCCRHRIVTNQRSVRTVVTIGQGVLDEQGQVVEVHGYFVDITDAAMRASRQEVQDAVDRSAIARADIEQAKGALMVVQGVTAEDAFAILRWHSSRANIKIRELARIVTLEISHPLSHGQTAEARLGSLLASLVPDYQALNSRGSSH